MKIKNRRHIELFKQDAQRLVGAVKVINEIEDKWEHLLITGNRSGIGMIRNPEKLNDYLIDLIKDFEQLDEKRLL